MSPIDSERARSRQRERAQTAQSQSAEQTASEREADRTTDIGHEQEKCPECHGQLVADHEHGEIDTAMGEGYASGENPVGLAAAALYAAGLVANEKVSQEEVSAVADISQVTIRNRYGELLNSQSIKRPHGA